MRGNPQAHPQAGKGDDMDRATRKIDGAQGKLGVYRSEALSHKRRNGATRGFNYGSVEGREIRGDSDGPLAGITGRLREAE